MKVIIFGATGQVGTLAVKHMLDAGHDVTAFARNPHKLNLSNPRLRRITGNAMSPKDVADTMKGHDAVVITLGAGKSRKSTIRSVGTLNVIEAMHQHGVRRLICQSTLGAHESWDNLNFFWKRIMFGALLRPVFLDHELQEKLVRASGLNWTLVRPSAFADGPSTGSYREAFAASVRGLQLTISKADIADFLTRQLTDTRYQRAAVGISN